ncbi:MAG: Multidrug resistance protein MdtA [Alphaproteobacteria bacterium MarineAlpha10_Bin1]|nr:MAG: Multidrug resistance protein MdtA [Alphaproteobacteria bacterium MarineAlpha10_Bin1]
MLIGALAVAGYLQATKPELEPEAPAERSWLISASPAVIADRQPDLLAYGEIVAQRDVEMRTLVAGQITAVGENFVDGGVVRAGDLLVQTDSFEFDAAVTERTAQVKEAEARLAEIAAQIAAEISNLTFDREQLEIAEREWQRRDVLAKDKIISEKALDDAHLARNERARTVSLGERNLQMLRANGERQQAVIVQTEVGLKRARRDLRNTRLLAPFDGFLTETGAAIGKRMPVNGRVARLIDLNHLEAKFHLSDDEFGRLVKPPENLIGRQARAVWRVGNETFEYAGEITRVGAEIDAASGGVQAYARIDTAGQLTALRPGAFVEVILQDRLYRQVARLPESALHDNEKVYVIEAGRLQLRLVELVARIGNDVLVHGELAHGEIVATTRFPGIGPGVKVSAR